MRNKVVILGGGTVNPISNHLQLCSFAKGGTASRLSDMFEKTKLRPFVHYSEMCNNASHLYKGANNKDNKIVSFHTNEELQNLINEYKSDSETKVIIMTCAVCDFVCPDGDNDKPRPDTTKPYTLNLEPADKIVQGIRDDDHKHIFLVAFKNTVNKTPEEMYLAGLNLCKKASCNLDFVNDTVNMRNMIVTPEEATYADGWERNSALQELVEMTVLRSHLS